jgi:hypothetical protein
MRTSDGLASMAQDYVDAGQEPYQPHTSIHLPRFIDRKTLLTTAGTHAQCPLISRNLNLSPYATLTRHTHTHARATHTQSASLFEEVTVEEPTYKEVVLLFKKKKTSQDGADGKPDDNAIFIQRFDPFLSLWRRCSAMMTVRVRWCVCCAGSMTSR